MAIFPYAEYQNWSFSEGRKASQVQSSTLSVHQSASVDRIKKRKRTREHTRRNARCSASHRNTRSSARLVEKQKHMARHPEDHLIVSIFRNSRPAVCPTCGVVCLFLFLFVYARFLHKLPYQNYFLRNQITANAQSPQIL